MNFLWIILFFAFGCTTAIQSPSEINNLKNIIAKNDVEKLRAELKNKSFTSNLPIWNYGEKNYRQDQAYDLLTLALSSAINDKAADETCHTEIVELLLESNLPPRSTDLATAAEAACLETVTLIMKRLSKSEIVDGSEKYLNAFIKDIEQGDKFYRDIKNSDRHLKVINTLKSIAAPTVNHRLYRLFTTAEDHLDSYVLKPVRESLAKAQIEAKYNLSICRNHDLFDTLYYSNRKLENNCVYILINPSFKVLQLVKEGILIMNTDNYSREQNHIIFIQTSNQFKINQFTGSMMLKTSGIMKYKNPLGVELTVLKFQDLN